MASQQTLAFAARHFADIVADRGEARLLKALSGHDGFDPVPVIREHLDFWTSRADSKSDSETVFLAALDYALGRMSSAVAIVSADIRDNWDTFSEETREDIKLRISAALERGRAGMDMDRREWATILDLDGGEPPRP